MSKCASRLVWRPDSQHESLTARCHYSYDTEPTAKDRPLPVRWSAIEVILDQKLSEASDVWSFGVSTFLFLSFFSLLTHTQRFAETMHIASTKASVRQTQSHHLVAVHLLNALQWRSHLHASISRQNMYMVTRGIDSE